MPFSQCPPLTLESLSSLRRSTLTAAQRAIIRFLFILRHGIMILLDYISFQGVCQMKKTFCIAGCGFLGSIVADAYVNGLLPDYQLTGVLSRTMADAVRVSRAADCAVCADTDTMIAMKPDYIVETASVEWVRENAVKILRSGISLVLISIGAFAVLSLYEQAKQAAIEGGAKIHLASGAIGGFDVLQTVSLMAAAQNLPETAGIETHTGCRGFIPPRPMSMT